MFAKPRQPFFDRNLLQLRGRNAAPNGFVVDLDDRRKIRFQRVANDHAARMRFDAARRRASWKKMLSNVG